MKADSSQGTATIEVLPRSVNCRERGPNLSRRSDVAKRICSIKGCQKPVRTRGWCNAHYQAWWNHGDPLINKKVRHFCSVPNCERPAYGRGLCSMHWKRVYRHGSLVLPPRRNRGGRNTGRTHFKPGRTPWNKGQKKPVPERTLHRFTCEVCGDDFYREHRGRGAPRTCSRRCFGILQTGPGHPRWRGGSLPEGQRPRKTPRYKAWRAAVYDRDDFTCQDCGRRGGRLHAHHIKAWAEFPELRFEVENGQTLCVECHKKTESWGRSSCV